MSSSNDEDDQFALRQKKRRLNKERAMLGIFDDDGDDNNNNIDDDRKKNALSKPLTFVSSGVAKKIDIEHDDEEERNIDNFEENDNADDVNDDDFNARPAMTGAKKVPASDGKPLRRADTSFEKFTKGIGSKLLAKMGYVGGGMAPIDVKVRPKGIGIGFGNFDERTDGEKRREKEERDGKKPSSGGDDEADVYDNDAMRNAAKAVAAEERARDGWKRGKQRTQRTQYITSLDHESRAAAESRTATINVIDMRGGLDAGGAARKRMPELYYNVRLLVDLLRVELVELDAKQRARRDQLVTLDAEHERLVAQAENERERLVRVERVRGLVEECGKRVRERRIDLDQVGTMFGALRSSFAREYELFRLSRLVHALAVPLIKQRLRGWAPLEDPDPVAVASIFRTWRDILLPPNDESAAAVLDDDTALLVATEAVRYDARLYHKLLEDHVLPPLRLALMRAWRPAENSDAAVPLVLAWRDVMPRRVFAALLESIVVPRLDRALHDHDRVDPLTMHRWLAVWQPIVGAAFEPLLASVRRMLLRGVERCEARLDDAREALLAWSDVGMDDASMQRVLERIVGAMERRLDATPIDPARPDSSALESVLRWFDFAPFAVPRLVHVLEEHFFAPWLGVTRQWLDGAPDFGELADWYAGWKHLFPHALLEAAPRMRTLFNHALDLLKCAFVHMPLPAAPAAPTRARARAQAAEQTTRFGVADHHAIDEHEEAFANNINELREAVSEMAAERGISFQRTARQYDNRDAYRLGNALVRFENGLLFERQPSGKWAPASIDALLDRASAPQPTKPVFESDID